MAEEWSLSLFMQIFLELQLLAERIRINKSLKGGFYTYDKLFIKMRQFHSLIFGSVLGFHLENIMFISYLCIQHS
jgi:hypothetical protein